MCALCYRRRSWLAARTNCTTCSLDSAQRILTSASQRQKLLPLRGSLLIVPRWRGPHLKQQRVDYAEVCRRHIRSYIFASCVRANALVLKIAQLPVFWCKARSSPIFVAGSLSREAAIIRSARLSYYAVPSIIVCVPWRSFGICQWQCREQSRRLVIFFGTVTAACSS